MILMDYMYLFYYFINYIKNKRQIYKKTKYTKTFSWRLVEKSVNAQVFPNL